LNTPALEEIGRAVNAAMLIFNCPEERVSKYTQVKIIGGFEDEL